MPTYMNTSPTAVSINNVVFLINKETKTSFFINLKDYPQLTKISDDPKYSPITISKLLSSGKTFNITENLTEEVILIKIVSLLTTSIIKINNFDDQKLAISSNLPLELRNPSFYNTITVDSGEVSVELWKGFSWRGDA